jgi:quercetin 2,3-dioxygenase
MYTLLYKVDFPRDFSILGYMQKKILRLEHPRHSHMVGDGFRVAQYIPGYGREMTSDTSPFLMLDYNAPWQVPPQNGWHRPGVGYHPHRGFETVTIVYSWEIEHQDTAWHGGVIWPDEVQWMTAGSGLLHNEFMTEIFSRAWGTQHMIQLWVDLPREYKMTTPRYQSLTWANIPEIEFDGGIVRVIAWELKMKSYRHSEERRIQVSGTLDPSYRQDDETSIHEQKWAAKTFSPVELYDIRFSTKWEITLTFPEWYNTMILVTGWSLIANEKSLENSDMLYFSPEWTEIILESISSAKILIMAGKPLEQTVVAHGPFVMNTEEEIEEAFRDFRAGKMGSL